MLTTVPECTPLSSSMSVCSTTDCGATEVSEEAPTEVSKDAPDACKYYTVRDGKYYDTAGNEQTSKWAKRQRHRQREEETLAKKLAAGSNSDAKGEVKEGPMAIAGPTGSNSNAEEEVKASPGSKSEAKGKVKEGPMAIAGPTGSDSNAEDAVMGTSNKKKKDPYRPKCAGCGENDTWRRMLETWSGVERHFLQGRPR